MNNPDPIIVTHTFDFAPELVWNAITNLNQMKQWYFPMLSDFKPEVGFETQFLVQNEGRNFTHIWNITEVIPLKRISYTWDFQEYAGQGLSTFELEDKNQQTLLRLKSFVLKAFPEDIPEFKRESGQAGWAYLIKTSLVDFLNS